jgi:hypothetical protein
MKLYLDIDDTLVDTEDSLRRYLSCLGIDSDSPYDLIGTEYDELIEEFLSDYHVIPMIDGARTSLKLLKTEYDITLVSCYTYFNEAKAKISFAKKFGVELILCKNYDKSHVDMSDGIFIDNDEEHLKYSNAAKKYIFSSNGVKSQLSNIDGEFHNWYDIVDILMGGDKDAELREYIFKRTKELYETSRVL